jgi:hypothetical protein
MRASIRRRFVASRARPNFTIATSAAFAQAPPIISNEPFWWSTTYTAWVTSRRSRPVGHDDTMSITLDPSVSFVDSLRHSFEITQPDMSCKVTNGGYALDPRYPGVKVLEAVLLAAFIACKKVRLLINEWVFDKPRARQEDHRLRGAMPMSSLRTLARGGLLAAAIAFAAPAPAQDIGSTIALPDAPFVLPVLSSYVFPADPRSGDVLTQRVNNNRDSATYVPGLNSNTVRGFRRIGLMLTSGSDFAQGHNEDGSGILTQPLYAGSALVHGERQPVVLFVSMKNFVYAYSARIPFNLLWSTWLGEPYESMPDANKICDTGIVGTEATPVIDLARNRIIISFMISDATHHIEAVDLNDGHVIPGSQKHLSSPLPDWDRMHRSRASLLLADDVVYVAMSGLCEGPNARNRSFFGSIFAFRASDLEPARFFPVTTGVPVDGGGIWQASTGLAADSIGNLYVGTGNPANALSGDKIDPRLDEPNFADSVLRLKVEKKQPFDRGDPSVSFTVADYFTPYRKVWLDWNDMDVAASGIVLIPGSRYLVAAGKEGLLYALDRADLGHFDGRPAQFGWRAADVDRYRRMDPDLVRRAHLLHDDPARDFAHQKFQAGVNQYDVTGCADPSRACFFGSFNHLSLTDWMPWPHIHGTPVFARLRDDAQFLFVWPEKDRLKRFAWNGTFFDPRPLESSVIAPPIPLPNGNHYPIPCPGPHPDRPCVCPHGDQCLNVTGSGMPGGMLAVNLDGESGQGVLFAAVQRCAEDLDPGFQGHPCTDQLLGSLRAFDPFTLEEVWNDCGTGPSLPGDCNLGHTGTLAHTDDYYFAKFVPPTVAGGRVFLATAPPPWIPGKVIVYGH